MKLTYWKGLGGLCDCCGTPLKNVYILEDQGLKFKVGSTCIKKFINVSDKSLKFIQSQIKEYQKYIDKRNSLMKGLELNDIELLSKTLKDTRDTVEVKESANKWIKVSESRANKILDELNAKLNKANIKIRNEFLTAN
jgi:hypothetical protein